MSALYLVVVFERHDDEPKITCFELLRAANEFAQSKRNEVFAHPERAEESYIDGMYRCDYPPGDGEHIYVTMESES